jgi:hypothetical protein
MGHSIQARVRALRRVDVMPFVVGGLDDEGAAVVPLVFAFAALLLVVFAGGTPFAFFCGRPRIAFFGGSGSGSGSGVGSCSESSDSVTC